MKNQITKVALFGLVTAALVVVPIAGRADENNKPAAPEQATPGPKKTRTSFHGKVIAVDTAAMTLSVESLAVNITSETRITKDGKPAMLSEIAVGDTVGGSYKMDDAGKTNAVAIRAGEKTPKSEKKKKADATPEPAK